ncbi:MAG: TetR/AcrR family transcriptional regulator C-terminal ligand-binding domain-containing protein [Mycobacterium sp.]|nr:TetR/AcrR family transcriptional regulator C-terminal ligand-binding domain-containing protein [Mycobacterium sp.]
MGKADGEPQTAIRAAAMAELAAVGVDDFTLSGVSKRAGVDVNAIARHWHDRRVLLMEAMLLTGPEQMPTPDTGSLHGDVMAFVEQLTALSRTEPGMRYLRSLLPQSAEADFTHVRKDYSDNRFDAHAEMFRRAARRGELRDDVDPVTAVQMFASTICADAIWYARPSQPDYIRGAVDIFLRGIAP